MISRIDHIAVAVKDHEGALRFFRDVLGALPGVPAEVSGRNFVWQSLVLGDLTRMELLSPIPGETSYLDGFLKKKDGGFHHITLQTSDIEAVIKNLEKNGVPYFGRNEYPGGSWKEVFIHPRDAFGTLIQIAEFRSDEWMIPEAKMPDGRRWEIEQTNGDYAVFFKHPGGGKVKLEFTREELKGLSDSISAALG